MKRKLLHLTRHYRIVLRAHLKQGSGAKLDSARGLGVQAFAAGLQTLDLAKLHEQTLLADILPGCRADKRAAVIKQAGVFFAAAITSEEPQQNAREATARLNRFIETLSQRTVELAASNLELNLEITQRKAVERALKNSEHHYSQLLKKSDALQGELRRLSRQILSVQEDERKRISRELHDVIAQTLTGINVRLATLKKDAALNIKGLDLNISRTQQLVEHSVNIVHQFARELRPAVLDDLGLIPALHSFLKHFTAHTGVRTQLTAFAGVEQLDAARRTVLYRVAQEALTNVSRHAQATEARVIIQKLDGYICMKIQDNGNGFQTDSAPLGRKSKRLGLLGMNERVEMFRGKFSVKSVPKKGTTIQALIPFAKNMRQHGKPALDSQN
jgi:signal transduction histidine kinase